MAKKLLESDGFKILLMAIGGLSGAISIISSAFPNPVLVRGFSLTAFGFVLIYIVFYLIDRLLLRKEKQTTYLYTSQRYGLGYDSMRVECIVNKDGSAIVQRTVNVEAFSNLSKLDAFLLIPEEKDAPAQRNSIDFGSIKTLTSGRKVTLEKINKEWGKLSAIIDIAPPLASGQFVSYQMTEQLPADLFAINLSDEKLAKRKTPYDYFGWSINRPTKKLILNIHFPEFLIPQDYGVEVRYASASSFPSERIHEQEKESIKENLGITGPEGGRYALKIEIEDPMIGLIYLIRWQPLKAT